MSTAALGNSQIGVATPGWCALGGWSLPPPTFPAAAGQIIAISIVASRVAFGNGSLGFEIAALYVIPSSVAFGDGALLERTYVSVFVNGVDISTRVLVNTIQITNPLSQVTTAAFSVWDPSATINPQVGQTVLIYLGGERIFGGTVDQPFQTSFQAMPGSAFIGSAGGSASANPVGSATGGGGGAISCTDFSQLLSRRVVGLYFDGHGSPAPSFLNDIVTYIVQNYLAQDGFTYDDSDGDPGINLGPVLFNWVTVQAAFNTLSSSTGWDFSVDPNKVIRFYPSASGLSATPFNIADNDGNVYAESLGVLHYRSKYRNRQGIASPSQQGQLWQDIFSVAQPGPFSNFPQPPDGIRKTFLQLYGFTSIPTVLVNNVQQTVAQLTPSGFVPATGWQWYIVQPQPNLPSYGLFQFGGNAALVPGDVLIIEYQIPLSPILWVENAAQIAARKAIEGGTGVYEDVQQAPSTTDPAALLAYANGLLARYSNGIPFQVTYATRTQKPLFAGMLQTIQISNPPLNFTGLISQVAWQEVDGTFMEQSVTVLSGEYQGDFTQFFAALVAGTALAPPANTSGYTWNTGANYPPGGTPNPSELSQVYIVRNAVEAPLSLKCYVPPATPLPCTMTFTVLVNGNIWFAIAVQSGSSGSFVVYPTTQGTPKAFAGDVIQMQVFFAVLFLDIQNVSLQLDNVVINT